MIFRRFANRLRAAHAAAAPASTLLLATIALTFIARVGFATPLIAEPTQLESTLVDVTAWVTPRVSPGDDVEIKIEAEEGARLEAYLPGLSFDRVELTFDAEAGRFSARLLVPEAAPMPGWFTLRVVSDAGDERDFRVHLIDPLTGA